MKKTKKRVAGMEGFATVTLCGADLTDEVAKELDSCGAGGGMARAHQVLASVSQCSVVVGGQLLPGSDFDARLATAARLTSNLRAKVFETLDYTVSAGVQLPHKHVHRASTRYINYHA